jgi:hypothetical protein
VPARPWRTRGRKLWTSPHSPPLPALPNQGAPSSETSVYDHAFLALLREGTCSRLQRGALRTRASKVPLLLRLFFSLSIQSSSLSAALVIYLCAQANEPGPERRHEAADQVATSTQQQEQHVQSQLLAQESIKEDASMLVKDASMLVELEQVDVTCELPPPSPLEVKPSLQATSLGSPEGKAFLAAANAARKEDGLIHTSNSTNIAAWLVSSGVSAATEPPNRDSPLVPTASSPRKDSPSGPIPSLQVYTSPHAARPFTCKPPSRMTSFSGLQAGSNGRISLAGGSTGLATLMRSQGAITCASSGSSRRPSQLQSPMQSATFGDLVATVIKLHGNLNASEPVAATRGAPKRSVSLRCLAPAFTPLAKPGRKPSLIPLSSHHSASLQLLQSLQALNRSSAMRDGSSSMLQSHSSFDANCSTSSAIPRLSNAVVPKQAPGSAGSSSTLICDAVRTGQ